MILVEVYVPAVDEKFDFELDENVRIFQIVDELTEMLNKKMKSQRRMNAGEFMLCLMGKNEILPAERTLHQCQVRDGSRLLLI